jgi:small subunit ribosomal protein S5
MDEWIPKTKLGKLVMKGKVQDMSQALATRLPLRESEIIDTLLPDMEEEVLDVNRVQRMTDSGRRLRFAVTVAIGNKNGFVGIGRAKGKEVGPTIRKAIDIAKLNIIEIKRGCGSWECGCGKPHTLPFAVSGKAGSVVVNLKPAPMGVSLAVGDIAKSMLTLAGVRDVWGSTKGHTRTTVNYAYAAFDALKKTAQVRTSMEQERVLDVCSGDTDAFDEPEEEKEEF